MPRLPTAEDAAKTLEDVSGLLSAGVARERSSAVANGSLAVRAPGSAGARCRSEGPPSRLQRLACLGRCSAACAAREPLPPPRSRDDWLGGALEPDEPVRAWHRSWKRVRRVPRWWIAGSSVR
jgi:hypothetical protein